MFAGQWLEAWRSMFFAQMTLKLTNEQMLPTELGLLMTVHELFEFKYCNVLQDFHAFQFESSRDTSKPSWHHQKRLFRLIKKPF